MASQYFQPPAKPRFVFRAKGKAGYKLVALPKPKKMKRLRERPSVLLRVLDNVSSLSELSRRLGVTRQAISQWYRIPLHHVPAIQRITGLPLHVLRPDIYPKA